MLDLLTLFHLQYSRNDAVGVELAVYHFLVFARDIDEADDLAHAFIPNLLSDCDCDSTQALGSYLSKDPGVVSAPIFDDLPF